MTASSPRASALHERGRRAPALGRHLALAVLAVAGLCLGTGGLLYGLGAHGAGEASWMLAGGVGIAYSLWTMAMSARAGRIGVDVIALLALVGAVAVGEYLAAAIISVMLGTGRALEEWAAQRARADLRALVERSPRTAHRYVDGSLVAIAAEEVRIGDRLLVPAGELVPADGILQGAAVLDESALSGEPLPVHRRAGDAVRSGVVNAGSGFDMAVSATSAESAYAGIVRLVHEAEGSQAPFVRLADQYSLGFLAATFVVASVAWILAGPSRAVAVLVVASPCPLILAAPVAFVGALSRAAERGVVVKGGAVLERLARCTTLLIDKTGTLTRGHPELVGVMGAGWMPTEQVLELSASLDQASQHVLARALVDAAAARHTMLVAPSEVEEVAGEGIRGVVNGRRVALGKAAWAGLSSMPGWAKPARRRARLDGSLTVFVSVDGAPAGVLVFDDPLRVDAARTIRSLRQDGIDRIVMVTGDRADVAQGVGAVVGVDEVLAERSPADKLDVVRAEQARAPTIMVGDGINDAPALALADVGVALSAQGGSAASEAADVVLTVDRLDRLGTARLIARRARRIALESVASGMAMSLSAMGIATAGFIPATWGAILQELIDVIVILNALRTLALPSGELNLTERERALTRRFQLEHAEIQADLNRLRELADRLDAAAPENVIREAREARRILVEDVEPHEFAEETVLYPALDKLLGGANPTAPMSRAHVEIAHQIRRLGQLVEELDDEEPDPDDVAELRRVLYGLHAILSLHTVQEEEGYLSLGASNDDPASAPAHDSAQTG